LETHFTNILYRYLPVPYFYKYKGLTAFFLTSRIKIQLTKNANLCKLYIWFGIQNRYRQSYFLIIKKKDALPKVVPVLAWLGKSSAGECRLPSSWPTVSLLVKKSILCTLKTIKRTAKIQQVLTVPTIYNIFCPIIV